MTPPKLLQLGFYPMSIVLKLLPKEDRKNLTSIHRLFAENEVFFTAHVLCNSIDSYLPTFRITAMDLLVSFYEKVASYNYLSFMQNRCIEEITVALDTKNVGRAATPNLFQAITINAIRIKAINQNRDTTIDNLCDNALKELSIPSSASVNEQELLKYLNGRNARITAERNTYLNPFRSLFTYSNLFSAAATPLPDESERAFLICENLVKKLNFSNFITVIPAIAVLGAAHPLFTERAKKLLETLAGNSASYVREKATSAIGQLGTAHPKLAEWAQKLLETLIGGPNEIAVFDAITELSRPLIRLRKNITLFPENLHFPETD